MKWSCLLFSLLFTLQLSAQKKVLLEKITSANCGSCPNASIVIEEYLAQHPDVIWVNHHWWSDGMGNPSTTDILMEMEAVGTPQIMVDRTPHNGQVTLFMSNLESRIQAQLNEPAYCDITINAFLDPNAEVLEATVTVNFNQLPPEGDLRLSLIVAEDDMTGQGYGWNQSNYFNETAGHPLFGLGQPIQGYSHKNVVRIILDETWGIDGLIPNTPELNTDYSHTFQWEMNDDLIQDPTKIELTAVVNYFNSSNLERKVLNAAYLANSEMGIFVPVDEVNDLVGVKVSPNPANDFLTINLPENDGVFNATFMSLTGQSIQSWNNISGQVELSLNDVAAGLYLLRIVHPDGRSLTRKIAVK